MAASNAATPALRDAESGRLDLVLGSAKSIIANHCASQPKNSAALTSARMIAFSIPGEPVAFARSGGNGKIRFTPQRQRNFMALTRLAAAKAMGGAAPLDGPIDLQIRAVYLIPKSWPKKRAASAYWRTSKPDSDNLAKIISDALNEIVFIDDAQVVSLTVQKVYGVIAGTVVSVMRLDDGGAR